MKSVKVVVLLAVVLILTPGLVHVHYPRQVSPLAVADDGCPPVQNTPFFTLVYGPVTINDQYAPAGAIVEARTPRGEVAGCFPVSTPGHYGAMYVYGEDTAITPSIPGMREGETVAFYVNGVKATSVPTLTWTNDWELHQVVLSATGVSSPTSFISIVKTVAPQGRVEYGDALTYTLVISAEPGVQAGLYDPLTGTTFLRFVKPVEGLTYTGQSITGTLTVTPTSQVTVSFAAHVDIPGTTGLTVSVTNRACVYPAGGITDDCVWSDTVTNDVFRPYVVYLPLILRF